MWRLIPLLFLFACSERPALKIKGSDTEVNLAVHLAESYRSENDKELVSVCGGGSGLGIASLLNGTADIANSSRSINEEEIKLFNKRNITIDSFVFAQDAIAFVVSASLPLDSINIRDIAQILSGKEDNWNKLTGDQLPINIYGRQSNSGTHDFVKKLLKIQFSPYAKQMNGNAQILEAIKADRSGIGYVGAGYVMDINPKEIKVLKIYTDSTVAVSPLDVEKIASGEYYFQRPLFQYFKAQDKEKVTPFLDFEKTKKGEEIIRSSGYYISKL